MLWKDSNNAVHDDMGGEALSLPIWPQGMTQITQAEADALLAPHPPTVAQQIVMLEATITPRRIREATLGSDAGWLKSIDAEIAKLRLVN